MRLKAIILALALATAVAGSAMATEIYKWTDEDGNVHYGDRPSGSPTEERLQIVSKRTDSSAVHNELTALAERREQSAEAKATRDEQKKKDDEARAAKAEREKKCEMYRARLEKFVTSRRLYREDEKGERVYLDENEMRQARQAVQDQVEEYCSP